MIIELDEFFIFPYFKVKMSSLGSAGANGGICEIDGRQSSQVRVGLQEKFHILTRSLMYTVPFIGALTPSIQLIELVVKDLVMTHWRPQEIEVLHLIDGLVGANYLIPLTSCWRAATWIIKPNETDFCP